MIKNTHQLQPKGTIVAYSDNSSIMEGATVARFYPRGVKREYASSVELTHTLMKVETHNHPTAISPFPGAATGAGGEIRDEGATGRGARPKAGLNGFSVGHLHLDGMAEPRRNPRRRRDRARRQAEGRLDRLHGIESAPAGRRALVGKRRQRDCALWRRRGRLRQARAHRIGAADHDRRPAGRRRIQQ
jgi:phosphoribosylformylglycinamidine synthase